ncbi:hypothetical protein DPMN_077204 [Dreissena polymorpha]|uniref:Uncharacterized protein n=1 Tax=Dreissena polymorpha TaxID=45954 RepID=A0A9D4BR53_DREPO|nr:hypothetical protein DPMN_077204 [Dreissena polymorpha]
MNARIFKTIYLSIYPYCLTPLAGIIDRKNTPPNDGYVFQSTGTIFELIQYIIGTNLLTKLLKKFYYSHIRKHAPTPGGFFLTNQIIFELAQDIIGTNLLNKKNPPHPVGHIFQTTVIIFELVQDSIETNLLTKFHEGQTINVASRELTSQILTSHDAQCTTHDGQKAITKAHHEHIVLR